MEQPSNLMYRIIPVTPFQQNCTLLWCSRTRMAAVVDPGGDLALIEAAVAEEGVDLQQIWLTHGHIDHAGAAGALAERLGLPIFGPHRADQFWLDGLAQQSQMFGFPPAQEVRPARWLDQGDSLMLGDQQIDVLHCPGHTPGHVVFWSAAAELALVGDVLFQGSIGRTDFPQGDYDTLIRSIREQLLPLGDQVAFIPGHGPMSRIGVERRTNPFLQD